MPTTRKKVIKTVYKDENDSEPEESGDFSDSGSDAKISGLSSSEEDEPAVSSGEEFEEEDPKTTKGKKKPAPKRKPQFAKNFIQKIRHESQDGLDDSPSTQAFSVKDLTESDKLLPSVLNLSESDSSDDESSRKPASVPANTTFSSANDADSDNETKMDYQDVFSNNIPDNSEEIAKKTFKELEIHKTKVEETKASILNYTAKTSKEAFDVKDLLAQGEEAVPEPIVNVKKTKKKKKQNDSDSEMEDWEEVKESKALPASGLQVVVDFPDAVHRKSKKVDVEMMMKRKMNRVKKEYQVYMHKVHVLCWLGHGNFVSSVLNDQEIMSAVLTLVPSKECYPGERVDMKYVEQITKWFSNKITLKQDKHEHKFRPKAHPLREILLKQISTKVVSTKKYMFFIFVSMLRAIGLQCRVMFNFVTLPIRPPSSELCSLSTKIKDEKNVEPKKEDAKKTIQKKRKTCKKSTKPSIPPVDGNDDSDLMQVDKNDYSDSDIMQVDGNDDGNLATQKGRKTRLSRAAKTVEISNEDEDVSPPKRAKKPTATKPPKAELKNEAEIKTLPNKRNRKTTKEKSNPQEIRTTVTTKPSNNVSPTPKSLSLKRCGKLTEIKTETKEEKVSENSPVKPKPRSTRSTIKNHKMLQDDSKNKSTAATKQQNPPKVIVTDESETAVCSNFFEKDTKAEPAKTTSRRRSKTADPKSLQTAKGSGDKDGPKPRSKSTSTAEKSKYFNSSEKSPVIKRSNKSIKDPEDGLRVSHRDILAKTKDSPKNDITSTLIEIMKTRMDESVDTKAIKKAKRATSVKGKAKASKGDSDYQPDDASDEDFKPIKISPRPSTSRKIDRRVLSTDDEAVKEKTDVWCEIFVEELEQWIAVDVVKGQVHCTNEIYSRATHPVCYVVGWDNNNYLKDLTRRYVPHWNTVTRKQRVESTWWEQAITPWQGPRTARDREEDESLDRMQLDAPLPKSIGEYKNHPLYALKRHLLKYEAIYPPDASTLGFVRNEAVYARECVYVCRSRDTWLKEAKVVKLGEKPYKIVKARPKWDKLSNKLITDKPLEIFGPWQVQDYEPPVAENGMVPRNAYGNVELFKDCMLPKGTVHIKLPGLNKVAKKLNIDCAPAMTGFDFNGGWSHPVYDGFVVCKEFEEVITQAWLEDQEEMERRDREKTETRVYGNWKRLIKGLMIRERLKLKYGFEEPSTSEKAKTAKGPRFATKKKT